MQFNDRCRARFFFSTKEIIRSFFKRIPFEENMYSHNTFMDEKFSNNGILQKYPVYEKNVLRDILFSC